MQRGPLNSFWADTIWLYMCFRTAILAKVSEIELQGERVEPKTNVDFKAIVQEEN